MGDWLKDLYSTIDAKDLDGFVDALSEDVVVVFANNPPAVGKDQVRAAIGGFFGTIESMSHNFLNVFVDGETTLLEADIDYGRLDGQHVHVPCLSVLHRDGEHVDQLRIFADLAPVFAPLPAAATASAPA
jgi:ketosteroid isomerase-like protein